MSRKLAGRGHFPAIDMLQSLSRVMPDIAPPAHLAAAARIRELLSTYRENEDLITIGAYRVGSNQLVDLAIRAKDPIDQFLRQGMTERASYEQSLQRLMELAQQCGLATNGAVLAGGATGSQSPSQPAGTGPGKRTTRTT
ncbi:MAG: hypothetical protein R3B96_09015 [Pirellulaceae bacterium]